MRSFKVEFTDDIEKEVGLGREQFEYEGGWWTKDKVYVCDLHNKNEKFLILIHEIVERILELEYGLRHDKAHKLAIMVENYVEELLRREGIWQKEKTK